MSGEPDGGPWFELKESGLGWRPVTWQGWASTLALGPVLVVTSLLSDERLVHPRSVSVLIKTKAALGLSEIHLSAPAMAGLMVAEVVAFLLLARWKSLTLKPLD
jgi:hypothetical protein